MKSPGRIRYAVIGAGNIAQMAVLPAFEHAKKNSQLVALLSSDSEKRAELADKYQIEHTGSYGDLERILGDSGADAVYIATPNSLHMDYTLRAAELGLHVLCEKPLATTVADCETMKEACERAHVKLMVAYRLHFEEANLKAIEAVRSGKLGEPKLFASVFTHVVRPGDIRERPELGGGATFDLGVYCINAARNLFADEPRLVFATTQERDGIDDTTTVTLRFAHDRVAQFTVSNSLAGISSYRISGTEGDLRVEPAYEYYDELEHHLTVDGETRSTSFGKRDQFAPELEYFSQCILDDVEPEPGADEAIADLCVVEAILQSARTGKLVTLPARQHGRGPSMAQENHKPPVSKRSPVHAPSPSLK
jgi:predicted dehydrogenase